VQCLVSTRKDGSRWPGGGSGEEVTKGPRQLGNKGALCGGVPVCASWSIGLHSFEAEQFDVEYAGLFAQYLMGVLIVGLVG